LGNYLIGGPEQPAAELHAGVDVVLEDPAVEQKAPKIEIEATITDLSDEQKARFGDDIEFWDASTNTLYSIPNPEGVDAEFIGEALRVTFIGQYDPEEDDFKETLITPEASPKASLLSRSPRRISSFAGSFISVPYEPAQEH
jgi:hypothetical protein